MANKPINKVLKLFSMFLDDAKLFEQIKEAPSVSQMVAQCYHLMTESNVFPNLPPPRKKSDRDSASSRSVGNKHFCQNEMMKALEMYTKALGEASNNSSELALAYANRSAVTFALEEYPDAIIDIERALNGKYPRHLRFKLLERKAKCLVFMQSYTLALSTYEEALKVLCTINIDKEMSSKLKKNIEHEISNLKVKTDGLVERKMMEIPKLSHPPSAYIECASEAVDIDYQPEMGRLIVASTDIHPGDVLAIEKPYASILLPGEYKFFCYYCKKRCHSMIPCLNCTQVFFCDEKCRTASWDKTHRVDCDILPYFITLGCDKMSLLALEIMLKMTKQGDGLKRFMYKEHEYHTVESPKSRGFKNGKYLCNKVSTYHLEMNHGLRSWADIFPRLVIVCCMLNILKSSSYFDPIKKTSENYIILHPLTHAETIVGANLLKYLFSVPCNAHEISEMRVFSKPEQVSESAEFGSALYPFLSLINHSCDPNVVRTIYNGDTAVLTAIQVIKKGKQIFDNYGYHHAVHNVDVRQESLCSQYFFVCKCPACLHNWSVYKELPKDYVFLEGADEKKVNKETSTFCEELKKIQDGQTKDKLPFLCGFLHLLHNSIQRPNAVYSECQEAIKECLIHDGNHYFFK